MKMIVGLGNPGRKYANTRHNMGWEALDRVADAAGIKVNVNRYHGLTGMGVIEGEKVILVKPLTYMNLSGDCVQPLAAYYKIPPEDILVICDDVNLPLGRIRFRKSGSAGQYLRYNGIITVCGVRTGIPYLYYQGATLWPTPPHRITVQNWVRSQRQS